MVQKCWILLLVAFIALTSIVSAVHVDQAMGPFKVSFYMETTGDVKVTVDPPVSSVSNVFTAYGMGVVADKWTVILVITNYNDLKEINHNQERTLVENLIDGRKSIQISDRKIDDKNAICGIGSGPGGTRCEVVYWLDELNGYGSKKVELSIASSYTADTEVFQKGFDKILSTFKVRHQS